MIERTKEKFLRILRTEDEIARNRQNARTQAELWMNLERMREQGPVDEELLNAVTRTAMTYQHNQPLSYKIKMAIGEIVFYGVVFFLLFTLSVWFISMVKN